jgi:hypothetical protein
MREDLERISKEMTDNGTPFLIVVFDTEKKEFEYQAELSEDNVSEILEGLIKKYGGEILDRTIDRILDDNETEWPATVQ